MDDVASRRTGPLLPIGANLPIEDPMRRRPMSGFETIIYEKERGRARITLNRPDKLNALSLRLMTELSEAVWEADNDRDVHCITVKGAGRAFSAGYDLGGGDGHVPVSRIENRGGNNYRSGASFDDD